MQHARQQEQHAQAVAGHAQAIGKLRRKSFVAGATVDSVFATLAYQRQGGSDSAAAADALSPPGVPTVAKAPSHGTAAARATAAVAQERAVAHASARSRRRALIQGAVGGALVGLLPGLVAMLAILFHRGCI